jgi:hypothetical protein
MYILLPFQANTAPSAAKSTLPAKDIVKGWILRQAIGGRSGFVVVTWL